MLFILAVEMVLGRDIIKNEPNSGGASIVPVAFPLIAGPGAITALLSLRADYAVVNILKSRIFAAKFLSYEKIIDPYNSILIRVGELPSKFKRNWVLHRERHRQGLERRHKT